MSGELVTFLRAQLDEDEAWARACSTPYKYADEGSTAPEGGVRWRWVEGDDWDTVQLDPVSSEFVTEPGDPCWLVSVEEWPNSSVIDGKVVRVSHMPHIYANSIVEMETAAAAHIARHDPARVLREVEAKRRIIEVHAGKYDCPTCRGETYTEEDADLNGHEVTPTVASPCPTLRAVASVYADIEGFRPEWAA